MNSQSLKTLRILLILTVVLLAGMATAYYMSPRSLEQRVEMGEQLGGDFQLNYGDQRFNLADQRGKVVLMYIGYASCPDVCPTGLGMMATALHQLTPEQRAQVQPLFVSVDPERDTPDRLKEYANYFYPQLIGATGSREQIDSLVRQYGAFYRIVKLEDSAMGYAVDHSSRIYMINQQGKLSGTVLHNGFPDELADALRALL
ncbi:MAG: SCO family protein [Marinobacterium sp.]|nr:SCO family protein [Marinobacterium sp.]